MRVLVLSDIHSNIEALHAVLGHAHANGGFEAVWCTGDIVGYGPDPGPVIDALRVLGAACVCGNHDLATCGLMGTEEFNLVAERAVLWTREQTNQSERDTLAGMPKTLVEQGTTLVHGSLRAPEWEYLTDEESALAHFELQTTPCSIVGHSHLQFICIEQPGEPPRFHFTGDGEEFALDDTRVILNSGSVGQPRDGDPRAGYLFLDTAAQIVSWHRVAYDHAKTRGKIVAAGLPEILGTRLALGR